MSLLTIAGLLRQSNPILFVPCRLPFAKVLARANRWGSPAPPLPFLGHHLSKA
jgi:hypothetical protein